MNVRASDRPLRVAIVASSLSRQAGGILPIMQEHAKGLVRLGVKVSAHGMRDDDYKLDLADWGDVEMCSHNPVIRSLAFNRKLGVDLRSWNPEIIHQHGLWQYPSYVVERQRVSGKVPVVISTQGMLEPWALANSAAKKRLASVLFQNKNLTNASVIHCSKAEVEGVREAGFDNPIAVLPNGADLSLLDGSLPKPHWMERSDKKTLLFFGRIHPKKGVFELVQAFAHLKSLNPSIIERWQLAIVGWDDGGHEEELRRVTHNLGLSENVAFPGSVFGADKRALLNHADAFILPSYSEGFPMAVLEAMACRLPLFITKECNIPESFSAGAAIDISTTPSEIAKKLDQSLVDAELAAMGTTARALAEREFSWDSIVERLLHTYRWMLGVDEQPSFIELR